MEVRFKRELLFADGFTRIQIKARVADNAAILFYTDITLSNAMSCSQQFLPETQKVNSSSHKYFHGLVFLRHLGSHEGATHGPFDMTV